MTSINKFAGYGIAVVAALAAAMLLLSTAYADITTLVADDDTIAVGGTATVTATFDAEPADNDTVTFRILASSTASGGLGDAVDNEVVCTLADTDAGDITTGDCDDGTAEVDITNEDVVAVTITVHALEDQGEIRVLAIHNGDTATETITVGAAPGDLANLTITGPATIANNGSANVTVVGTDTDGDRVAINDVTVQVTRGTLAQVANECAIVADDDGVANDTNCSLDVVTSTTAPARVGVYENGDVGQTIRVTAFVTPGGGTPVVGSLDILISGGAASATIETEDTPAGGTSTITVTALDANGNAVADDTDVTVAASAGTVAACSNGSGSMGNTRDGVVTCTYVAPATAQSVVITAVIDAATDIVVTDTLSVGGAVVPGAGSFTGSIPASGVALVTFDGGTVASLAAAAQAAGALSVSATQGGQFIVYIVGAPAFVNAAFNAAFPTGLTAGTPVILFVPAS